MCAARPNERFRAWLLRERERRFWPRNDFRSFCICLFFSNGLNEPICYDRRATRTLAKLPGAGHVNRSPESTQSSLLTEYVRKLKHLRQYDSIKILTNSRELSDTISCVRTMTDFHRASIQPRKSAQMCSAVFCGPTVPSGGTCLESPFPPVFATKPRSNRAETAL